jgi:hypothetical protein
MTRIPDGFPRPLLQPETTVQFTPAPDGTEEACGSLPSGSVAPPGRRVLVSYDEFKDRRQLRRRVNAAFERLRERALDGTP